MKAKCRNILFSFGILLILTSCGVVKKEITPRYRFDIGRTLYYKLKCDADITLDAGFFKYSGKVNIGADINITAVSSNENGYKIQLDIKNPDIQGADNRIITAFYMGLNSIRSWFADFYLSDKGKAVIIIQNTSSAALNSFSRLLFPDFTDFNKLMNGISETTNFNARFQDEDITIVFKKNSGVKKTDITNIQIENEVNFISYAREDFLKTVEPLPIGYINLEMTDSFNYFKGKLANKKGKFKMNYSLSFRQGFLTYSISALGNGNIGLELTGKD